MDTQSSSDRLQGTSLHWGDILVIVGYFVLVIGFGIWSSCRNRGSIGGYFLAGRSMHWIPVGASLFASNIGSGHFIGLAGSGAASGIGIAVFELNAIFILILLGWIFAPVYIASGVFTLPEYLRKRFGGQRIRVYLAVMALLLSIFTKISADLYSGALFITQSVDMNLYLAVILLLAVAALFTIAGGLTAVIWTDFIQTIIMLVGACILMVMSFNKVGSFNAVQRKFFGAWSESTRVNFTNPNDTYGSCGIPPANSMHLIRSADDGDLPWPGVMFGLTISSIWYWCSDQVIVQRTLAAKNMSHVKGGTILAGYLKFLPMWLIVLPGMMARILFPNTVACSRPDECLRICGSQSGCTNIAYPQLVLQLMPAGLRGMMLAVVMSALISSLTSIFNSSSTLFTMDIWRQFRKHASDIELMIVGRICIIFLVGIGIAWIPIVQNFSELFHYIQSVTSFLAPPVCAIFILAVLWKRTTEQGAFWALMVGLVVGLTRFIWESVYPRLPCGDPTPNFMPSIISKVHYLHFGIILWGIVTIVAIVISILTEPIADKHLVRLTFWDRHNPGERIDIYEKEVSESRDDLTASQPKLGGFGAGNYDDMPWYKKAANWICGTEKMTDAPQLSESERMEIEKKDTSIHEEPRWRAVANANAVILMLLAVFFWGFFA